MGVTDSVALSRLVDGVVVVAKVGTTTREMVGNCLTQLRDINAKILGLVLNEVPVGRDSYYYNRYYHYYGYKSGKEESSPDQPS